MTGERFSPKDRGALLRQIELANERLSGSSVLPPSMMGGGREVDRLLDRPIPYLRELFPVRYSSYLAALRHQDGSNPAVLDRLRERIARLNRIDEYVTRHSQGAEVVLRDEQFGVFKDIGLFLEDGQSAGYLEIPTGVGKTVIFIELLRAVNERTIIVVPTVPLIDQTAKKIAQFAPDLDVGTYWTKSKQLDRQVTITTYASLISLISKNLVDPSKAVIVLDEGDEILGDKRSQLLPLLKTAPFLIAVSATSEADDVRTLESMVGPCISEISYQEAVWWGLLCGAKSAFLRTGVDLSMVRMGMGDFIAEDLERTININPVNQLVVRATKELAQVRNRLIGFTCGVDHAMILAKLCRDAGISAQHVSGREDCAAKLESFKRGEIQVLFNDSLLVRGFDDPGCDTALFIAPTTSPRRAKQRFGRITRLDEERPLKFSLGIDLLYDGIGARQPIYVSDLIGGYSIGNVPTGQIPSVEACERIAGRRTGASPAVEALFGAIEVTATISRLQAESLTEAPEGWLSERQISTLLEISTARVRRSIHDLELRPAQDFGTYLDGRKPRVFYSPKVVDSMRRMLLGGSPTEPGDAGRSQLESLLARGWLLVKDIAVPEGVDPEEFRLKARQWCYKNRLDTELRWPAPRNAEENKRTELVGILVNRQWVIKPELVPTIVESIKINISVNELPPGWERKYEVAARVGLSPPTVDKIVSPYVRDQSMVRTVRVPKGHLVTTPTFIAPEMIALIEEAARAQAESKRNAPPTTRELPQVDADGRRKASRHSISVRFEGEQHGLPASLLKSLQKCYPGELVDLGSDSVFYASELGIRIVEGGLKESVLTEAGWRRCQMFAEHAPQSKQLIDDRLSVLRSKYPRYFTTCQSFSRTSGTDPKQITETTVEYCHSEVSHFMRRVISSARPIEPDLHYR